MGGRRDRWGLHLRCWCYVRTPPSSATSKKEPSLARGVRVGLQAGGSGSLSAPLTCNPGEQAGESGSLPAPLPCNSSKGIGGRHVIERPGQSGSHSACLDREPGLSGNPSAFPDPAPLEITVERNPLKFPPSGRGKLSQNFPRPFRTTFPRRTQLCSENYKRSEI